MCDETQRDRLYTFLVYAYDANKQNILDLLKLLLNQIFVLGAAMF